MSVEEDTELRDIVLETLEQRGVVGRTKVGIPFYPNPPNHPILNLIYNNHHHAYLLINYLKSVLSFNHCCETKKYCPAYDTTYNYKLKWKCPVTMNVNGLEMICSINYYYLLHFYSN